MKTNVLFLPVDDLRPQLHCYGHPLVRSPHIDSLAVRGTLFERAYCQQAICAPSRSSLLSGCRPDTTKIYNLETPLRLAMPDVLSLPQHFLHSGYETVSLGKIYHHSDDDLPGWSSPPWRAKGAWQGRGYLSPESIAKIRLDAHRPGCGPAYESADVPDSAYMDGMTADKAVEELRRLAKTGRPFFLAAGFLKPHLPFVAPKRYWDLYDRGNIHLPARDHWPDGMPAVAGMDSGELRQYADIPKSGPVPEELAKTLIHGYCAATSYTDACVGQLLAELDRLGLRDSTVVVLWGDHGWKLGEYGAWCKHTNFEIDTHAPLLLAGPGVPASTRCGALVEFVDVYPTLCELAGLPVPGHCEGTSMVPLLKDPHRPWKRAAFSQYPRKGAMGHTLRDDRWRYTEWYDSVTGHCAARELYDHSGGDVAAVNLADEPAHAETAARLSSLLDHGRGWKRVREAL